MDGASAVERVKGLGLRFRVWGLGYSMKTFATVRRVALARKYGNAVLTQQKKLCFVFDTNSCLVEP